MAIATLGKQFNIGVLMGGISIEREVSFNSGRTVCDHLDTSKFNVIPLFQDENGLIYKLPLHFLHRGKISDFKNRLKKEASCIAWDELKNIVDFVYIAVHGRFAEDGTLQGMLELLKIPYLGAKVLGSALGMNKIIQKEVLRQHGVAVPKFVALQSSEASCIKLDALLALLESADISFPCVVKPVHEGSSLGISIVNKKESLIQAVRNAAFVDKRFPQEVIIEEKIEGLEFVNVSLEEINEIDGKQVSSWFSFPPTEVLCESGTDFFDYEQKYMPGRATKITPARCSEEVLNAIAHTCQKAAVALEFKTIARIDGIVRDNGEVVLFDPNSLTGMGPATFLFHQAAEHGMSHTELINFLIETELKRYGLISANSQQNFQGASVAADAGKKIRVAVLLGGTSNEKETSLESGRNVCYKLSPQKYEVIPLFVNNEMKLHRLSQRLLIKNSAREIDTLVTNEMLVGWAELPELADFVFIGLHGGQGENGTIQGALEMLQVPYNGSGVMTSAMCMDKYRTTTFLRDAGFLVPKSFLVTSHNWLREEETIAEIERNITYPCIVKPSDDGCSVFVSKVEDSGSLAKAVNEVLESGKEAVLVEELVSGMELTCGVYGNDEVIVLPPSQSVAKDTVLSAQEKFLPGDGQNITPALLSDSAIALVQETIKKVYKQVACKGYARIDCFYQTAEQSSSHIESVVILEINTLPALTPATCLFHQAAEVGKTPMDLIDTIVTLGLSLHQKKCELDEISSTSNAELKTCDDSLALDESQTLEHLS